MTDIVAKYEALRPFIQDGDLILYHGTSLLSKIIQTSDKNSDHSPAYHNHVGIIIKTHDAFFTVDSNASGVQADRLSLRIKGYAGGDFTIIRPLADRTIIDAEMSKLLKTSDDKWIKYDFLNGAKELANRRFGWHLKIKIVADRDICSDYVLNYAVNLNIVNDTFKDKTIVFPEDYFRYIDLNNARILGS